MTTKLTLSVEKETIDRAKRFAQEHNRSLSEIVARYLECLTGQIETEIEIDPEVLALSDEIQVDSPTAADDAKYRYLRHKYLNA